MRFELGKGHRTQTGIEVKIEFGFCAGLAIAQTSKLFGVAKEKFDLKTRWSCTSSLRVNSGFTKSGNLWLL